MIKLMYCGNRNVFDGLLISLMSIVKYTKQPLEVYVLTMDLRETDSANVPIEKSQSDYIESVIKEVNSESRVVLVDVTEAFKNELGASPNLKTSYTPYTLVRLFADKKEEIPDKILYLDTDTLARSDIGSLYDIDVAGYEFAGVKDYLGRWFINPRYINAGVLLLNMQKIRQTGLFARARKMCVEKKMFFPDQTALNRLVQKKLFISRRFNEQRKLQHDTVIQHFCKSIRWLPFFHTVNVKPWHIDDMHKKYGIHEYDDILSEYQSRKAKI